MIKPTQDFAEVSFSIKLTKIRGKKTGAQLWFQFHLNFAWIGIIQLVQWARL